MGLSKKIIFYQKFYLFGHYLFIPYPELAFVDSLSLIIAQRLVKMLCFNCKLKTQFSEEELKIIKNLAPISAQKNTNLTFHFLAQGCQYCNETGYSGF